MSVSWDELEAMRIQEFQDSTKETEVLQGDTSSDVDLQQIAAYQQELITRLLREEPMERTRTEQRNLLHNIIPETSIPGPLHFVVIDAILDDMYGNGPVHELYNRPTVTDIQIFVPIQDGETHRIEYVENGIRQEFTGGRFRDKTHAINWLNNKLSHIGQWFDPAAVTVDGAMPDGSRIHAVYGPSGYSTWSEQEGFRLVRCLIISIRRFGRLFQPTDLLNTGEVGPKPRTLLDSEAQMILKEKWILHQNASVDAATMDFFRIVMQLGINFLIAGGTGAGKTTFGNALTTFLPPHVVMLIIEESPELQAMVRHAIRLYEDKPNVMGSSARFSLQDALKAALRMFPDRIFIAEIRDHLAYLYLKAIQSGHDGSFTTIHASDCTAALRQLVTYAKSHPDRPSEEYLQTVIGERLGVVFHLTVDKEAKAKGWNTAQYVDEVVEVFPQEDGRAYQTRTIMKYERGVGEDGKLHGYFHFFGPSPAFVRRMAGLGIEVPESWR